MPSTSSSSLKIFPPNTHTNTNTQQHTQQGQHGIKLSIADTPNGIIIPGLYLLPLSSEEEAYNLLFAENNPAGVKAFLYEQGLVKNILRLPLVPVSTALQQKIKAYLQCN